MDIWCHHALRAVRHLPHLMGIAILQMSNLSARGGHVVGMLGQVSLLPMGSLVLMSPAGLPPLNWGPHSQSWQSLW